MSTTSCPVPWCTWDPGKCSGDHFSSPGEGDWPEIHATAWMPDDVPGVLIPHPVWGESDGLAPAVAVWIRRDAENENAQVDDTFDLTPDEAEALANQLIRAAQAARATTTK